MSRLCGKCLKENPDQVAYCISCGSALDGRERGQEAAAVAERTMVCEDCGTPTKPSEACPICGSRRLKEVPREPEWRMSMVIGAVITAIGVVAVIYGLLAFGVISFIGSETEDLPVVVMFLGGGFAFILVLTGAAAIIGGTHCIRRTPGGWQVIGAVGAVVAGLLLEVAVAVAAVACLILLLLSKETD